MAIERKSDQELIELSLEGDRASFAQLFRHYHQSVMAVFIRYRCNEFDAHDLMQETFIKAFINLKSYNCSYKFSSWITTIARNTFIDYTRRGGVRGNIVDMDSSVQYGDMAMSESPEEAIIAKERRNFVEAEIEALPGKYRKIIELRYFMGLSYEEIASELSMPIGTVKTHLYRAKKLLNEILNNDKIL